MLLCGTDYEPNVILTLLTANYSEIQLKQDNVMYYGTTYIKIIITMKLNKLILFFNWLLILPRSKSKAKHVDYIPLCIRIFGKQ